MTSHSVCLLGFSDFERRALALQFKLAAGRTPSYVLVATPPEARFIVVDGDTKATVQRALDTGRLADCVFVGTTHAPGGALARLRRPIDALSLLRELDAALMRQQGPQPTAGAAAEPPAPRAPVLLSPVRTPATVDAEAADSQLADLAARFPDRVDAVVPTPPVAPARCDALLVDDSEIALKFLERKLGELGLRARGVTDSDAALEQLKQHDYNYVFLDVELGPGSRLDGLALCRQIKRRSGRPPVVAMVSAHASQTDRVRGSLAGCDAYLGKPLQAMELAAVVNLRRAR